MVGQKQTRWRDQDLVTPLSLLMAAALILPPLQTQAWWLILPGLICVMLRWRLPSLLLILGGSLYADSWIAGVYFLLLLVLMLVRFSSPGQQAFRWAFLILLQATPLMLVLALLFGGADNRLSGANLSGSFGTGISGRMAPGTVSQLVANTDLAMRVRFEDGVSLKPEQLYWRGIVMENFNGRFWSRALPLEFITDSTPAPDSIHYEVTLEPNQQLWMFALHQPHPTQAGIYLDRRDVLIAAEPLRQRVRYTVASNLTPDAELELSEQDRRRNLALPESNNPQTREWVAALRMQYPDAHELTQALLLHFNREPFYYTMSPPLTGEQSVDDFMFGTRQGFCEHYASALTFALRAAGIPARVVTGYQGGRFNALTGHWSVYQYNAHAWVEAWYPDQGWVQLDPTRYIAPQRIDGGMDAWLATLPEEELDTRARLRLQLAGIPGVSVVLDALEAVDFLWNQSVFDDSGNLRTEQINQWLEARGLQDAPLWLMALLLLAVGLRAMTTRVDTRRSSAAALTPYLKFDKQLRKLGLGRRPDETLSAHLHRLASLCPEHAHELTRLAHQLSAAVYGHSDAPFAQDYKQLLRAIRDTAKA